MIISPFRLSRSKTNKVINSPQLNESILKCLPDSGKAVYLRRRKRLKGAGAAEQSKSIIRSTHVSSILHNINNGKDISNAPIPITNDNIKNINIP